MDKYGLIAQSSNGSAAQVEKVDHTTAVKLLSSLGNKQDVLSIERHLYQHLYCRGIK